MPIRVCLGHIYKRVSRYLEFLGKCDFCSPRTCDTNVPLIYSIDFCRPASNKIYIYPYKYIININVGLKKYIFLHIGDFLVVILSCS